MTECALFEQLLPEIRIIIVRFIPTAYGVMCYARTCRRAFRDVIEALPLDVFKVEWTEVGRPLQFGSIEEIGGIARTTIWKPAKPPHYTTHWLFREDEEEEDGNNDSFWWWN